VAVEVVGGVFLQEMVMVVVVVVMMENNMTVQMIEVVVMLDMFHIIQIQVVIN
jgi:hypothetical protein